MRNQDRSRNAPQDDQYAVSEALRLIGVPQDAIRQVVSGEARDVRSVLPKGEVAADSVSAALEQFVNARPEPSLLVGAEGMIVHANQAAQQGFDARAGGQIDRLNLLPDDRRTLLRQIEGVVTASEGAGRQRTGRVATADLERTLPLVIVRVADDLAGDDALALVMIGGPTGQKDRYDAIFRDRGLSRSEIEVVDQFMAGRNLSEIAELRGRSLATVRKQFYTICEKFGVASQADLMRVIYEDASMLADAHSVMNNASYPDRQEAQVLRPDGRTVEVFICGDMAGAPVILIPSPGLRTWPAATERKFREAGLRVITIICPGTGRTSPPPAGQKRMDCAIGDVAAVMDQLGVRTAAIMVSNFGLRTATTLALAMPDRFSQIICQSLCLPSSALKPQGGKAGFLYSVQGLLKTSKTVRKVAISVAARTFQTMGPAQAVRVIHRGSRKTIDSYLQPENMPELTGAFHSIFAQNPEAAGQNFVAANEDWTADVARLHIPVKLIVGSSCDLHDTRTLRAFADEFDHVVTTVDVSGQGIATAYDLPDVLIGLVKSD